MIITCPSCSARYAVDSEKIGVDGRRVKCAKCAHTWQQPAPASDPEEQVAATAPADRPGIGDEAREPDDDDFAPDLDDAFRSRIEASADEFRPRRGHGEEGRERGGLPAIPRDSNPWITRLAWLLLVVVVTSVIGGVLIYRDSVVTAFPASLKLYDIIGMAPEPVEKRIGVRGVKYAYENIGGANVLNINGELVNTSKTPGDVPDLRVLFLDESGTVIKRWRFAPPERRMLPGEIVKFTTQVTAPPANAKRIDVGFDSGMQK